MTYLTYSPVNPDFIGVDGVDRLEHQIRSLFDRFPTMEAKENVPPIDLYEDKSNLYVDVELPGFLKEEVRITIHKGALTIKGERKKTGENNHRYLYTERDMRGTFSRSFTLPVEVDVNKVDAKFTNGILHITMPKSNPRDVERTIEVN